MEQGVRQAPEIQIILWQQNVHASVCVYNATNRTDEGTIRVMFYFRREYNDSVFVTNDFIAVACHANATQNPAIASIMIRGCKPMRRGREVYCVFWLFFFTKISLLYTWRWMYPCIFMRICAAKLLIETTETILWAIRTQNTRTFSSKQTWQILKRWHRYSSNS